MHDSLTRLTRSSSREQQQRHLLLQILQQIFGVEHGDERRGGGGDDDDGGPGPCSRTQTTKTEFVDMATPSFIAARPERNCTLVSLAYLSSDSAEVWLVKLERIEGRECEN